MRSADIFGLGLIVIGMLVILAVYGIISLSIDLLKLLPGVIIIAIGMLVIYFKDEERKIEKVRK